MRYTIRIVKLLRNIDGKLSMWELIDADDPRYAALKAYEFLEKHPANKIEKFSEYIVAPGHYITTFNVSGEYTMDVIPMD